MAIKFVNPQEVKYVPLDLNIIDKSLDERQQRFDLANTRMADQMQKTADTAYLDPIAREKILADQQASWEKLAEKNRGRLGTAMPEVLQTAYQNLSNPWYNTNKTQLDQAKIEDTLASQYGAEAIKLSNVRNQSLLGPDNQILSAQDPRLKANVVRASDYQQIAHGLGDMLDKNLRPIYLQKYKGNKEIEGYLMSGDINELSDKSLKLLVNDPSVQQAFKTQAATYALDNRANVEYDPTTGTNIFTRDLQGKDKQEFSSGVAKYMYGVLRQKLDKDVRVQYDIDPEYAAARKAAGLAAEQQAAFTAMQQEGKADVSTNNLLGNYTPNFDSNGNMLAKNVNASSYPTTTGFASGFKYSSFNQDDKYSPAQLAWKRNADQVNKSLYGGKLTDQQLYERMQKTGSKYALIADIGLQPEVGNERKAYLRSNLDKVVIHDENTGKSYNFGTKEGMKEFQSDFGTSVEEAMDEKGGLRLNGITGIAPANLKATKKGGGYKASLATSDGYASLYVTTPQEVNNAAFVPLNQHVEAIRTGKAQRVELTDTVTKSKVNGISIPYDDGDAINAITLVPANVNGGQRVMIPVVNSTGTGLTNKWILAKDTNQIQSAVSDLAAYAKTKKLSVENIIRQNSAQAKNGQQAVYNLDDLNEQGKDVLIKSNQYGTSVIAEQGGASDNTSQTVTNNRIGMLPPIDETNDGKNSYKEYNKPE